MLWLPHACVRYLNATGDLALLDRSVPFLVGEPIPEGAEDRYDTPAVSEQQASIYEHAARSLDRSLRCGVHGLPLMGTGDWNDGMNRVGHEGRGESVWLGWFLCRLVEDFAPIARGRGDATRADRWEAAAIGWRSALNGPAWDGQWFKRAFFDNGEPLGSHGNAEARIDLIAQAWSVLGAGAPPALQRLAMKSVDTLLFDHDAGLIRLLDPPLAHAMPSAGYIQAYPPGVRENGGQYSHAGVWALMAQAQAPAGPADRRNGAPDEPRGDRVWRYFKALSPAHRASRPADAAVYAAEPYVVAGDVYSQPPYVGRGGWSWYTGAAAWLHRAAIESMFGLQQGSQTLRFTPCLPTHWPQAELTLTRDGRALRFVLMRGSAEGALARFDALDGSPRPTPARLLMPAADLAWTDLPDGSCFVIPLPESG